MEKIKKFTIMKALEILQGIRYYDSKGNIVYNIVDECIEMDYLEEAYKNYCPRSVNYQHFLKILRMADILEHINIINTTNKERDSESLYANNSIHPFIKIKRKTYYGEPNIVKK